MYVVFAPDSQTPFGLALFKAWFAGLAKEGKTQGKLVPLIGMYDGKSEFSFVVTEKDFELIVQQGFVRSQESVMFVSQCNKQYAILHYQDQFGVFGATPDLRKGIGSLKEVSRAEAIKNKNWSYNPVDDLWFIAVAENPDTVRPDPLMDTLQHASKQLMQIEALARQYEHSHKKQVQELAQEIVAICQSGHL